MGGPPGSPHSGNLSDLFYNLRVYKLTVSSAQLCSTTNVYVTVGKYSLS